MKVFKLLVLAVLTIALGVGVLYCVTKVGDLNGQAAIYKACISAPVHAGCPKMPVTQAVVDNLHDESSTIGSLGWVAFIALIFGFGSSLFDVLSD